MPRWSISPSWSSANASHGLSSGTGPVDSPPLALRWSVVMQRKSFLNASIALKTALALIAQFEAQCVLGDDRLWRFQSHVLRPIFVRSDVPILLSIDPQH